MLMRTDPFGDLDRLARSVLGTPSRPTAMPMDAYRKDNAFLVHLDLPGVAADSIDVTVERNVLTVHAERRPVADEGVEKLVDERPYGVFTRQLFLGESLDTDNLSAQYADGVLTLTIPVLEQAKPRRVEVAASSSREEITA